MGQQHNKIEKRRRRKAYLERVHERAMATRRNNRFRLEKIPMRSYLCIGFFVIDV
jgi:hypothetical protein